MDWTDLYLRTETEQDLRATCPFLVDSEGDWLTAVPEWLLDVIGPIVTEPAIHDDNGNEVVPAVIDERFHANLRCTVDVAALVPAEIRTNPATPGRVFAGDPPRAAVPSAVTMRQAKLQLSREGLLPRADAALASMPGQPGEEARIEWQYAAGLQRGHPLVAALGLSLGLDDAAIDTLFRQAATL